MLAMAWCIGLFLIWWLVGFSVVQGLRPRNILQNLLLAPAVGLACVALPLYWLSYVGFAVRSIAIPLAGVMLAASIAGLWRMRPKFPGQAYFPFALVLVLALVITGWPMAEFGFNWLSYANDDMTNYALEAQFLANHAYYAIPAKDVLMSGRDMSLEAWVRFSIEHIRSGAELLLAFAQTISGRSSFEIFMPLILSFHLALVSATGALICRLPRFRVAAFLSCLLMCFSALSTMAVIYQLLAQVLGLALLCGVIPLLFQSYEGMTVRAAVRHAVLLGIMLSGFLLSYPEAAGFLGLGFITYAAVQIARRHLAFRTAAWTLALAAGLTAAFLNSYASSLSQFTMKQVRYGMGPPHPGNPLFPTYLLPVGLANLWGLIPIGAPLPGEPWLSLLIAIGGVLLVAAVAAAYWQTWEAQPYAAVALVMLGLGLVLFIRRSDFGLFKLAMYVQPFLIATVVAAWLKIFRGQAS